LEGRTQKGGQSRIVRLRARREKVSDRTEKEKIKGREGNQRRRPRGKRGMQGTYLGEVR